MYSFTIGDIKQSTKGRANAQDNGTPLDDFEKGRITFFVPVAGGVFPAWALCCCCLCVVVYVLELVEFTCWTIIAECIVVSWEKVSLSGGRLLTFVYESKLSTYKTYKNLTPCVNMIQLVRNKVLDNCASRMRSQSQLPHC